MKRVLSVLLIGLFAVALVFAQEKAAKPQKAKTQKMECCKETKACCSEDCCKMKSEMKGSQKDCPKADMKADQKDCSKGEKAQDCPKMEKTQKEAAPKAETK